MRASRAVCALVLSLLPSVAFAEAEPIFARSVQQKIVAAVNADLRTYGGKTPVPGAFVGLWYPGHGTFVRGFGFADLGRRRRLNSDDAVRVGSNTKTFVITVLLQLVDEKRLTLDDPVSAFALPVHVPNGRRITVRQLMQMRSGIIDIYALPALQKAIVNAHSRFDRPYWVQRAVDSPRLFAPGTKYDYSNTNYMLLGMIAEAVSHDRIEHQIATRILTPLGLHRTSFPVTAIGMPAPYAHGYSVGAHGGWKDVSVALPPALTWAAGVMISVPADMKKWVKAYVSGTMNGRPTQRARLTCLSTDDGNLDFGLGIGCSAGWYGYTGGITGYNTAVYYLPARGATLIALVSAQRDDPAPGVANAIFRDLARIVFPTNVPYAKFVR